VEAQSNANTRLPKNAQLALAREEKSKKRKKKEAEEKHKERNIRYNQEHTTWSVTKEQDNRVREYQESLHHLQGAFIFSFHASKIHAYLFS
jgi:hypothetical protein